MIHPSQSLAGWNSQLHICHWRYPSRIHNEGLHNNCLLAREQEQGYSRNWSHICKSCTDRTCWRGLGRGRHCNRKCLKNTFVHLGKQKAHPSPNSACWCSQLHIGSVQWTSWFHTEEKGSFASSGLEGKESLLLRVPTKASRHHRELQP